MPQEPSEYQSILEKMDKLSSDISIIKEALMGTLGANAQPGIIERVRRLEDWVDKRTGFEKVLIAAIMVELVSIGFIVLKVILKIV